MKDLLKKCFVHYDEREFSYEDMYKLIRSHSTILDRINPRKMLLMTFYAFDMLSGIKSPPDKKNWHILKDREYEQYDPVTVGRHKTCD